MPWLAGHVVIPYDAIDEDYPTLFFVSQSLRHGQLPWWNPYLFTGFAQISDPQAMIFSPFVTLPMAAVANPTPHWLDLIVIVHILFGGIGIFGLLRLMGLSYGAAIFGSVIALGGGCLPARLQHTSLVISACILPWAAWALLALCKKPNLSRGVLFGLSVGWMGLHLVQTTFIGLIMIAIAIIVDIISNRTPVQRIKTLIPPLLIAGLVTILICGIQVVALLTFLPETNRTHLPLIASAGDSAPFRELLTFFWPNAMHTFTQPYHGSIDMSESIIYCGYLAILGFVVGLPCIFKARWMPRSYNMDHPLTPGIFRLSACLLVFSLIYALGTNTPLYALIYHTIPGTSLFRRPVDAMFLATFCLIPLAALGVEKLLAKLRHSRALSLAVPALPVILLCWDLSSHTLHPNQTNSWPQSFVASLPNHFAIIERLHQGTANPGQPDWRTEFSDPAYFWPDLPAVNKIYSTEGYNPMSNARYDQIFGVTRSAYAPVSFTKWTPNYNAPLFALLGVKYIASRQNSAVTALAQRAGLKLVYSLDGMNVWETNNRLARIFSPTKIVAATPADAPTMMTHIPNLAQTAVLEASAENISACGSAPLTALHLIHYGLDRVSIDATGPKSSGWLIMTDPDTPGWHAYVDDHEVPLFRADGYMRAVCVPAGTHTITFQFEPFRQMADFLLRKI